MIIAVDYDGTLCVDRFPDIGEPKQHIIDWVKNQQTLGHKIILWTCREGELLEKAERWCKEKGIFFDSINDNIQELKYSYMGRKKVIADMYLDDKALKLEDIHFLKNANQFLKG